MSTPAITMTVQGREQLIRDLEQLSGPELRRVAKRAATVAMKPTVAEAKAIVDTISRSGRLSASIGQVVTQSERSGFVGSRVGIRRDFVYRSASGEKLINTGGGRVGFNSRRAKKIALSMKRGAKMDDTSAQQYASLIHFGVDKSGRIRRNAGPLEFLEQPIESDQSTIIDTVVSELQSHLETTK